MDELERILKNAILDSVRRWAATEPLKGYALLLDGDLQTVLKVWPSRGVLEEEGEHILFVPSTGIRWPSNRFTGPQARSAAPSTPRCRRCGPHRPSLRQ
jgi:hypothetical protein